MRQIIHLHFHPRKSHLVLKNELIPVPQKAIKPRQKSNLINASELVLAEQDVLAILFLVTNICCVTIVLIMFILYLLIRISKRLPILDMMIFPKCCRF